MKKIERDDDLAVFGAPPLFREPLHVGRPNVSDRDAFLIRVGTMLDSGRLTNNGPMVRELEAALGRYMGVRHCVLINNGTVALEIAIRALGLEGEVVVPSFTFIATAHAVAWQRLSPVFADIDESTHNLDPDSVEACITPATSAILGVHVWGRPAPVEALEGLAKRRGLRLIFDAAHALGCSHRGRMIGNFGDCEVFSFHATKFFNTFEGGAITTNDGELAARCRLMRNFGFRDLDDVVSLGINGKMPEVCAAMGLTELENIGATVEVNRRNFEAYKVGLSGCAGIRLVEYDRTERNNFQYVVAEIEDEAPLGRDDVVRILRAENVLARRYFHPGCHEMEPHRAVAPARPLPRTMRLTRRVVSLPSGRAVDTPAVAAICALLRHALRSTGELGARLRQHA